MNKTIVTIAVCLSFVVNSILITWSFTRRTADDLAKINRESGKEQIACLQGGGKWVSVGGPWFCQAK